MNKTIKLLGFAGSLRHGSYNKALLRAAAELLPDSVELETFDLEGLPPYNMDLEKSFPARVVEFKAKIRAADALLIATPEHNYSLPGVLKNAIDWGSRPFDDNVFENKPLAIMGASVSSFGTVRAQHHLRQICVGLTMHPLNSPEVMVSLAQNKIDQSGNVTDEKTRAKIKLLLVSLVDWTKKLQETRLVVSP